MAWSKSLFVWLFFLALTAGAQDRYMVFFTDKEGTPFSIEQPLEFLSQRALDRQAKEGYVLTEEDLPVNPDYVQALRDIEGVDVFFTSRWFNAALVQMLPTLEQTVLDLSFVSSIEYVAPNAVLSYTKVPVVIAETFTNPAATTLTTNTQVNMLGADQLHAEGYTGEGILLAVFDGGFTGVNLRAPFALLHQENRIIGAFDYVMNSGNPYQYSDHGTRVLSCIAGKYSTSFTGTAPDVRVILAVTEEPYKPNTTIESEYRIEEYNWLLAAEMADSAGVDIINSSLGYSHSHTDATMDYTYSQMDGETTVITKAANEAAERGILVVNSAGNDGNDTWTYISAPADSPEVLTVGAVTSSKQKSDFSSIGPTADGRIKPDVAAMGSSTVVVSSSGNIVASNGTSFSSPLMAGFAASVWQLYPEKTRTEIMQLIKSAGSQAGNPNNSLGWGIPTYERILNPLSIDNSSHFAVFPNPFSVSIAIRSFGNETIYSLLDMEGKVVQKGIASGNEASIQLADIPSGLYFLRLQSGNFSETVKLLKK